MPTLNDGDIGKIMARQPVIEDGEVRREPDKIIDPANMIRNTTGLGMSRTQAEQNNAPDISTAHAFGTLTPEEAAQLGLGEGERIDVETESMIQRNRAADARVRQPIDDMASLIKGAVSEEEERLERHTEALQDETTRKEIFKGNDPVDKVTYRAPITENGDDTPVQQRSQSSDIKRESTVSIFDGSESNVDDLVPSYDHEEDVTPPEAVEESTEDKRPKETDSEQVYANYLKELTVVNHGADGTSVLVPRKEKTTTEPVSSGRMGKAKILGDQAFLNSITKFKKDTFRTITIPLVNSGFSVDVVGTGAVDLTLLYNTVDQNTLAVDYELEKMRTIFRNIVDANPKVDKNNLRNMIHFTDYQLIAAAHLAATLKDVEMIHSCTECGKDFRIMAASTDLILNMDELRDRMEKIKNATTIEENSLMTTDRQITTDSGFIVNIGHPSYSEYIQYLSELKAMSNNLTPSVITRVSSMSAVLPFIRSIVMPNQVRTNNLYQKYMAMGMLDDQEYTEVVAEIKKLKDSILVPRFGIKRVECPHCHTVNTEIAYESLTDLLFFHFMVSRLLNETEE